MSQRGDSNVTRGTTSERFIDYLKNVLSSTLSSGSIVVMDNMRSHHTRAVKDFLEQTGIRYLYLPPYSLDLNPIEKMWYKLIAFLKKEKSSPVGENARRCMRRF